MTDRSQAPAGFSSLDVAALSQNARMLQVRTPLDAALAVERMVLRESVSELFALTLDCLASSAELDVQALLGREISVSLLLTDGNRRQWHAVVEGVDALGADGGLARYRLHAAPWLAALGLRRDSFLYQDKSVTDILSEIFADYPQAAYSFDIAEPPAPRPLRTQYRETDLAFVLRLMAEAGLSFRFDHQQGEQQDEASGGARHRLLVFDTRAARPPCPDATLRFHRSDATETEDSITRFGASRAVRPNAVTRLAWDDRKLLAHAAHAQSDVQAGAVPRLEDYDYDGHGRHADGDSAELAAARSLQAHEARMVRFDGGGTARQMMPGHDFTLTQHSRYAGGSGQAVDEMGGNRYTLLHVEHEAANNLGSQAAQALGDSDLEHGSYRNTFGALPAAAPLMPGWRAKPTAPEGLAAVVVAAQDAPISSGRDLRIKVQFPWQRGARPLPGGLAHRSHGDDTGNAPGDDSSGTWLRVAGAQAGPNWGAHHLPRKGTEVLVEFLDGDIDQPVASAQLYNDADLPPWSAGEDAEANHPGRLSGWHSKGLDGEGHSQWLFDDTPRQMRTRLSSSIGATQLGLGYLVEQGADESSRGAWRGTGFELRSDAWTVVRSGQGMLLSANAREDARSTQADAQEALALLRGAQNAAQRLDAAGTQRQARALAATSQYDTLTRAIDPKGDGRYPGSVGGQQAVKASGGERTGTDAVERIDGARMLIDAPSSLNFATPASAILHASENLHVTAQADGHVAARRTFATASGRSTSLFVQDGGIRAVAAESPVSIHAHTDMLEMLAGQDITVTSTTDSIEILANQSITLQAAGASIVMNGGDILFKGPGMFSVKGASHNLIGPASDAAALPALPSSQVGDPMLVTAELVHRPKAKLQAQAGSGQALNAAGATGAVASAAAAGGPTAAAASGSQSSLLSSAGAALASGATAVSNGLSAAADGASGMLNQAKSMAGEALKPVQELGAMAGKTMQAAGKAGSELMSGAMAKAGGMAQTAMQNVAPSLTGGATSSLANGATQSLASMATPSLMDGGLSTMKIPQGAGDALAGAVSMPQALTDAAGAVSKAGGMAAQASALASQASTVASPAAGAGPSASGMLSGASSAATAMGNATAASALGAASNLTAAGSGGVGSAIGPVMSQAMGAMGGRPAALSSAVNTLLAMPDVNQGNLPAVAGAILSTPGLTDSAIPSVVGAILQSPTISNVTLPKVAEAIMNIPAVANSPYPAMAKRVMEMAGVGLPGPVARPAGAPGGQDAGGSAAAGTPDAGAPTPSAYRARSGAKLQYVNLKEEDEVWNDGQALDSLDRQTNKPRIRVRFNKAGQHRFSVKVSPRPGNAVYSAREQSRQPLYREPNQRSYSYVTDADGTKVVDNITLPAAGLNTYTFEVVNDKNQIISTEQVETARRLYLQEIMLPGPEALARRHGFQPTATEYARHGVDVVQLPPVSTRGDANMDVFTDDGYERLRRLAASVYPGSQGPDHEPYTLVVCHIDRLATMLPVQPIYVQASAGPGAADKQVQFVNADGTLSFLWHHIEPGVDWYVECLFEYTDPAAGIRQVPIPKDRMTPVPYDPANPKACDTLNIRMAGLVPVPTSGKIILKVRLLESSAGGVAFPGTNLLGVAAMSPWEPNTLDYLQQTLVHEIGHLIGMTPSGPEWVRAHPDEADMDSSKLDKGPYFYSQFGNHCHFGLPASQADPSHTGSCVMFGGDCVSIRFCASCAQAVRKTDMSNGWPSF
ncbi:type VI secretion system tip protein TssI/VgrG [Achromobacter aegrifaciens]|uniref:type VI secretion system tip protein TssI/VgrG n=1 Tax=Achromobacter aegrifaciens TaxID=1287736 RepID=UPI00278F67B1|nr:type VI secretion system tip protein TssI/VgrG [Achromobacter aegrifaciens]MDQ1763263.1 type VI secretion system tip protein TssI/VgrG [Achromobacter aegrifaciens]